MVFITFISSEASVFSILRSSRSKTSSTIGVSKINCLSFPSAETLDTLPKYGSPSGVDSEPSRKNTSPEPMLSSAVPSPTVTYSPRFVGLTLFMLLFTLSASAPVIEYTLLLSTASTLFLAVLLRLYSATAAASVPVMSFTTGAPFLPRKKYPKVPVTTITAATAIAIMRFVLLLLLIYPPH